MHKDHPAYDDIGAKYEEYAQTASLKQAERYTFLEVVGPLDGLSVLDVACGFGYYSRLLKSQGAARVVGVDVSPEMIRLAKEAERGDPAGVEYCVGDGKDLPDLGGFDLVTAVWLLNYAETVDELCAMLRGVRQQLRDGDRFVTITFNPEFTLAGPNTTKYGLEFLTQERRGDRPIVEGRFCTNPPSEAVTVSQWSRQVYEWSFAGAGFGELRWEPYRVPPDLSDELGDGYWDDLRSNGPGVTIVARGV